MPYIQVSVYLYEVLFVPGRVDLILNFCQIEKKGKELNAATALLKETNTTLKEGLFDLILGDGLYYTREKFQLCEVELHAHLLIKTSERLNVVKDVEFYCSNNAPEVVTVKGYDSERLCSYCIQAVKNIHGETIDYPLQVAIVTEEYTKTEKTETFYVITSDPDLTPSQIRYLYLLQFYWRSSGFG